MLPESELVDEKTYKALRHTCERPATIERNGHSVKVDRMDSKYFIPDPNCLKCAQKWLRQHQARPEPIRPGGRHLSLSERDNDPSIYGR